ncbi:hypothetical protein JYT35_00015 [Acidimicrobium ferrooxidans]|uniref:D-isomer specific 2-hydroxyacid dehydrogenase NAD-binding domain-containing protein n=1 Tax=Acidimicrobium ferrooxidans TaxID=53635 RepID=A0ABS3APN1_9ACTN|nr:hypothetical protein [Acidimicrobium ferrooxidans]
MAVLVNASDQHDIWMRQLQNALPDEEFRAWPDVGTPADIQYVLAWNHPIDQLHLYENLKAVLLTGAGFDHIDLDAYPPVPVVRLVDPAMSMDIALYVLSWVIHFQRDFDRIRVDQAKRRWREPMSMVFPEDMTVGVFGRGAIGNVVLKLCQSHRFNTLGWSRSSHDRSLIQFMADCDVVVNLVPKSAHTVGIIGQAELTALDDGVIINVGRGVTIDGAALLGALNGRLRAAVLDVFETEPLPPDSPLWDHPRVTVTPHVAGRTDGRRSSLVVADSLKKLLAGTLPASTIPGTAGLV